MIAVWIYFVKLQLMTSSQKAVTPVKTGVQMLRKYLKKLDSDPEQESRTGWSLPANVCGGFIPHLIRGRNDEKL